MTIYRKALLKYIHLMASTTLKTYQCPRCHITSTRRGNMRRHLSRKRVCEPIFSSLAPDQCIKIVLQESEPCLHHTTISSAHSEIVCPFCNKVFTRKSSLTRHQKSCKTKHALHRQQYTEQLERQNSILLDQNQQLMKMVKRTVPTTITNHITNNITHQTQIILNAHGCENLSHITESVFRSLYRIPYDSIIELLKYIHFHPDHPENHNVMITNVKGKHAKVWYDGRWNYGVKDTIVRNMVDTGYNLMDANFYKHSHTMSPGVVYNFTRFQDRFDSSDRVLHKSLEHRTEVMIMNHSDKVVCKNRKQAASSGSI